MGSVPRSRLRAALLLVATAANLVSASPLPRDNHNLVGTSFEYLFARDECDGTVCGADDQFCCSSGETCTTLSNNVATCVGGSGGYVGGYTTTWTETKTYTSTVMTEWLPAPSPTEGEICIPQAPEQEACGTVCCAGWQSCAYDGQCASRPGYDEPSTIIVTTDGKVTTRYSAPYRVTGTTVVTATETQATATDESSTGSGNDGTATRTGDAAEVTETDAEGNPIAEEDGGSGGGLSAGAIAGIVIGVIAGVMLLMLLAFCCIARGCWNLIFGRKKEKRERVDVYEESYRGSRPPPPVAARNKGWFGFGRGDKPSSPVREKKNTDGKWWLGLAGAAATLLALLNLKKDKKPERRSGGPRSRYSESSYFYSDSSPSSASSGKRTHHSRRTRRSDGSRSQSRYTRRDSRAPSRM